MFVMYNQHYMILFKLEHLYLRIIKSIISIDFTFYNEFISSMILDHLIVVLKIAFMIIKKIDFKDNCFFIINIYIS